MTALHVNRENFHNVTESDKTVLLDFFAPWCGPCQRVLPLMDEIAGEHPDILVGKVNVEEQLELARAFGVSSVPTLVVMKNGKIQQKSAGARPKAQILQMIGR